MTALHVSLEINDVIKVFLVAEKINLSHKAFIFYFSIGNCYNLRMKIGNKRKIKYKMKLPLT